MTRFMLNEFGSTLTDRAGGKHAAMEIMARTTPPIALDFSGVLSLGSSFGDEVILCVAARQNQELHVVNANNVVKNSIRRIVEDSTVHVFFEP